MGQTAVLSRKVTVGNKTITESISVQGDVGLMVEPTGGVAAAKAGTLTGRTDNDTGIATLGAGHDIISTDVVDIYWADGARYGMTATVAGVAVSLDGGTGDNLPILTTVVTVKKPQVEQMLVDSATMQSLGAYSQSRGRVRFLDGADAELYVVDLPTGGKSEVWINGSGVANPVASDIAKVSFSHGISTSAQIMSALALNT